MNWLYAYRNFTLGLCLLLSIATLGLTAHSTHDTMSYGLVIFDFEGIGLFICSFSWIVFPVMLAIPEFRKNAYISYILSEVATIACMWALWVAFAVLVIQRRDYIFPSVNSCDLAYFVLWCHELLAIQGMATTIFTLLLVYLLVLVLYVLVNQMMGNPIWLKSVKEIQTGSNQMPSHQDSGMTEARVISPTISTYTPGHSVLVTSNTAQQGLISGLGTQPVFFSQVQPTTQSPGIPV